MAFAYFSKNGVVLPITEAVISLFNIEYSYGFGVYENLRVHNGVPYFLDDHVSRLLDSAKAINLEHEFTTGHLKKCIHDLIDKLAENPTFNIKILLLGTKEKKDSTLYLLPLQPFFPDKKLYVEGAKLISITYERWLPQAKTLNMLPSYVYYSQARKNGCYDVLFVDKKGNVLEGSRTNFFLINRKTIFTAPEESVLSGVTSRYVLKVALDNGYSVKRMPLSIKDLKKYSGAFLTSTSGKIVPVIQINDFRFENIPDSVKNLMKLFDKYLNIQV